MAKIRVKEGDKISVGQVIATLGGAEAAAPAAVETAGPPATATPVPTRPIPAAPVTAAQVLPQGAPEFIMEPPAGVPPAASPSIRKMARDLGIDLARVRGTEPGGRIGLEDLRNYIQRLQALAFGAKPVPAPAPVAQTAQPAVAAPAPERIDFAKWGPVTRKALSPLRQTIGRRMSESWASVPRVTQFDEADITVLNDLRKKHAPAFEQKGARLTLTSFAVQAVVSVLKKHPIFNSSLDEATHELVLKQYYHIGLAVDTEQGLIVPVIRDADKKNLVQLSKDISELAEKARTRKLTSEEMQGGTFTISNQGGVGGGHFTPIVNKPEVAILGLGRGAVKAVVRENRIEPRLMLPMGISYDHRVIDGASAARFIVDLVKAFEQWSDGVME